MFAFDRLEKEKNSRKGAKAQRKTEIETGKTDDFLAPWRENRMYLKQCRLVNVVALYVFDLAS